MIVLDPKEIAKEIYFACMEISDRHIDPTLPECEFIARKIIMFLMEKQLVNQCTNTTIQ